MHSLSSDTTHNLEIRWCVNILKYCIHTITDKAFFQTKTCKSSKNEYITVSSACFFKLRQMRFNASVYDIIATWHINAKCRIQHIEQKCHKNSGCTVVGTTVSQQKVCRSEPWHHAVCAVCMYWALISRISRFPGKKVSSINNSHFNMCHICAKNIAVCLQQIVYNGF